VEDEKGSTYEVPKRSRGRPRIVRELESTRIEASPEGDLAEIKNQISELTSIVQALADPRRERMLPLASTPESLIKKAQERGTARVNTDLRFPDAGLHGPREDDVVRLREGTDVYGRYTDKNGNVPDGVIRGFMYVKRNGLRKYKVHFEGVGEDGLTEDQFEVVG
jgi:hypothetical protein